MNRNNTTPGEGGDGALVLSDEELAEIEQAMDNVFFVPRYEHAKRLLASVRQARKEAEEARAYNRHFGIALSAIAHDHSEGNKQSKHIADEALATYPEGYPPNWSALEQPTPTPSPSQEERTYDPFGQSYPAHPGQLSREEVAELQRKAQEEEEEGTRGA